MKVKDMIQKLKELDPELPVCLADWGEEYLTDSEKQAEKIYVVEDHYFPKDKNTWIFGKHVRIGGNL